MDILTLVGLVAGVLIVVLAMLANASVLTFLNLPGLAIVLGGTFAVTLIKFRMPSVMSAFRMAFSAAFTDRVDRPDELIREVGTLAQVVRKEGILGLENHDTANPFLRKAINLCVDGHPPELVEEALAQEIQQTQERYEVAERVFRGIGESAPAIGMLGTLVGLVQMLNNLDDPASIGPAMAIALLTTLYGAFIAQLMALPLADKLQLKGEDEVRNQVLITTSIRSIMRGENPRVMTELLSSFVTPEQRKRLMPEREA
ncbi:MotA/TolQ/ExbB proton channel family protein [Marinobacter lutaoensis]|jgi:chemotaxis protein MotA|uniref:Flagellar motor protein PomA n=1 Tax=Marinobacter lutaoensis TaxID=135739 RepID=A0A1V2DVC3_9GAMM|nr:MotA/TolQ/ExbB proton channel family protein [Marinobacter lutaoensis]MBI43977.1 flagellar motor protein PomA [Oceanospirillales bacterium]NVD34307.1 MotA/TolQ/ExbB proton channel family protein [Marinobacter lutaoensis]ONF44450.1 flagellar motor protein PomA [Marinobacter lutaoensis]|tara:strand:+ start:366 stop:1139 length:774 start_codon:yes stop_codon:yes gene_type:complete